MRPTIQPTLKQHQAWGILQDNITTDFAFGGGAGGGKAQPLDSLILTKTGFVSMGSLKIGDRILTPENKETKIIAIHPQGLQDIYEIEFIDGAKIRTTKEHLFDCWIAGRGQIRRKVRSLEEILKLKGNVIIPLSNKLDFGKDFNLIDSYTLGVLLGDGGLTKNNITLTTADKEIISYLKLEDNKIIQKKQYQYSITSGKHNEKGYCVNQFLDKLKTLELIGKRCEFKFIPEQYKNGSIKNRIGIIQGLMDTDGTSDKRGHCSFCSKSKQLALDLQYVIRSIGGKVTLKEKNKFCWYKGEKKEGIYYELYINYKDCSELFKLSRKKIRCKKFNGGVSELGRRITSIKLIGKEESQCITLNDSTGLYISNDFVVTHNSWLGCEWLMVMSISYPDTRYFIARKTLKNLKKTTLRTFFKVTKLHGLKKDIHYNYNDQSSTITFLQTNSTIDLLEVKYNPSDPDYEDLGSSEYTSGWIEEAGEADFGAYDSLKTRIGRQNNDKYGILGKILLTCNPKKNFLYRMFYIPWKKKKLPTTSQFLQSLVDDNPRNEKGYKANLQNIKDVVKKQRLLFGKWEYDDEPNVLILYDNIIDLFTNVIDKSDDRCLTVDVARFGEDKTVIMLWHGFLMVRMWIYHKQDTDRTRQEIRDISIEHKVPYSRIVIDEDGIGGGVIDSLSGVRGFVANSRPLEEEKVIQERIKNPNFIPNFKNLKTQCAYKLADKINAHLMAIDLKIETQLEDCSPEQVRELIIQDLEQIKENNFDKDDMPRQIVPKDEVKQAIGRSPDYGDNLIMRMLLEFYRPKPKEVYKQTPYEPTSRFEGGSRLNNDIMLGGTIDL